MHLLPTVSLFTGDPDNDSIVEDYVRFTYRRTDQSALDSFTTIDVVWGTDLAGVWTKADATTGVVTVVEDDAAATGVDLVNVYIPRSLAVSGRLFARLQVAISPAP